MVYVNTKELAESVPGFIDAVRTLVANPTDQAAYAMLAPHVGANPAAVLQVGNKASKLRAVQRLQSLDVETLKTNLAESDARIAELQRALETVQQNLAEAERTRQNIDRQVDEAQGLYRSVATRNTPANDFDLFFRDEAEAALHHAEPLLQAIG